MDSPVAVDDPLWTIEELAEFLQVSVGSIRKWRVTGYGPRGLTIGRHLRFRRSDVLAWIETR